MTRSDENLLAWVVEHAGRDSVQTRPRWSFVGSLFGYGSTSAIALCRRFGFDPDETMGGASCPIDDCCCNDAEDA